MYATLRTDRQVLIREHSELSDWEAWLDLEGKSPVTLESYMYTAVRFVERNDGKSLLDATDSEILEFLSRLPAKSRKTRRAHLASFYEFALTTRRLSSNPLDFVPKMKKPARKVVDVFDEGAQAALLQTDSGRIAIMLGGGLRLSEAANLRGRDIDLERGRLVVRRGKGGKGRVVPIAAETVSHIATMMLLEGIGPDDYIWFSRPGGGRIQRSKPADQWTVHEWWKRCVKEAGVEYKNLHTTRHTYATNCLRSRVRIEVLSKWMGHASLSTTMDLYGHLTLEDTEDDLALLNTFFKRVSEKTWESVA